MTPGGNWKGRRQRDVTTKQKGINLPTEISDGVGEICGSFVCERWEVFQRSVTALSALHEEERIVPSYHCVTLGDPVTGRRGSSRYDDNVEITPRGIGAAVVSAVTLLGARHG